MSTLFAILKMLGCLGMFLYGMSLMSGGLQKLAGNSLRAFLAQMTSNKFKCVLTGIFVTALVQSSTATTLMLVSFVNAGLLALANAIGVIMGANIGTTVTAWIFALSFDGSFSLGAIAIPLMFFAFIFMSMKATKWKNLGEFLMGFGFLFLGLSTLKETAYPLLSSGAVQEFLRPLTSYGMLSVILFMIIGAIMTLCLQSSAATMSLTMLLVSAGVIPFNIAASVANVSAKRTARAHMLFNLFGVAWVLCLFNPFLKLIGAIVEALGFANPITTSFEADSVALAATLPYCVATLHTLFNVVNTLILIWFIPAIEKVVKLMVPSPKDSEEVFKLSYIGGGLLNTAELSLNEASKEIIHFGEICAKGFRYVKQAINEHDESKINGFIDKLVKYEEITDNIEYEIANYLNEVSKGEISGDSAERIKRMYKIIGEMESLGDSGEAISRMITRMKVYKQSLDEVQMVKLNRMVTLVENAYSVMIENLKNDNIKDITNARDAERRINEYRNVLREEHIANLEKDKYNYRAGTFYMDIVSELEKIGDFIINISQALIPNGKED